MGGYIKVYRKVKYSMVYQQPPLYLRVFERLIIEANHKCARIPYDNGTKLVRRGERLTSLRQIAEWVGWYERGIFKTPNPKTIKSIIDWLEAEGMIEILNKGNRKETHYKAHNYCIYQALDSDGSNSKETVGKQSLGINKNGNNDKNGKKENKPSQIKFDDDSLQIELSKYLHQRIRENDPKIKTPNFQTWAEHMDKLMRIDGRSENEIRRVIDYCQKDSFWKSNILSTRKLREKFSTLVIKSGGDGKDRQFENEISKYL